MTAGTVPAWALRAWRVDARGVGDPGVSDAGDPSGDPTGQRAAWGFVHDTWLLARGGRTLVAQRRADRSDPAGPRPRRVREAVRAAGVPVPEPTLVGRDAGHAVVTLPFLPGRPGPELLADDAGAERVGRLCGRLDARLAGVDPAGLGLSTAWASGEALRRAGGRWIGRCAGLLHVGEAEALAGRLEAGGRALDAAPARFAHGDLAPVNVLVLDDAVVAVLDLDHARLAHPLFDAAWFTWVVTHHHPGVARAAWRGYAAAAGLAPDLPEAFSWLQPVQLLERAAGARRPAERATWVGRLRAALSGAGPR